MRKSFLLLFALLTLCAGSMDARSNKTSSIDAGRLSLLVFYPSLSGHKGAQGDTLPRESGPDTVLNKWRLALIGGTLVTSIVAIHLYQQSGWWRDNRTPFHFQEDLLYGLNVDKIGHFYAAHFLQYYFQKSLMWTNMKEETALWLGSGGSLLFQTYVEMEDGFSAWGFDRVDFASDLGGALWPVARHYYPWLTTVDLKFSYHPSALLGNPGGIGFKGQKHIMIDDYEGQTCWLSLKVKRVLPEPVKQYWPDFLCLAVGYAGRDIATPHPFKIYFLALDLDMTKVIPQSTPFLKFLGESLNFVHMPLPAVQIVPHTIWYGIYF